MPAREVVRPYLEVIYFDAERYSPVKPSALARESAGSETYSSAEAGGLGPGTGNEGKDVARLAKLRKRLRQAISVSNSARAVHNILLSTSQETLIKTVLALLCPTPKLWV